MTGALAIGPGTWRDYERLAETHYLGQRPATAACILAARCVRSGELAGVLVVSMPTLNSTWRRSAWGERYEPRGGRARAARALNREVRTISRVLVSPAWRGLGVGVSLVRAYLASPLTRRTEAIAAMGRYAPIFERAGMRRVRARAPARERALRTAFRRAGVAPWRFADARRVRALAARAGLRDAALAWARAGKGTRGAAMSAAAWEVTALAAMSLTARRAVFVAG
ncbi:MAG: hypothetical protein SFY69_07380 [Planctomycetota bacterium]|nr:hypothetical protein [Planctomycetota bacterium]